MNRKKLERIKTDRRTGKVIARKNLEGDLRELPMRFC